jgi:hypothetical protein
MSHKATVWAIQQRGLKPATKIVLWFLCDRHNPDFGCFPTQARLADDAEMSISALNEHLAKLQELRLIHRVRAQDPHTHKRQATRYILGFEDGFPQEPTPETGDGFSRTEEEPGSDPTPDSGHGAISGFPAKPSPDFAQSHLRNPETNLVREPLSKPVKEEEDAQARDSDFDRFFAELLTALGFAANATLPTWWQGWPAKLHVRRWRDDLGLSEVRIIGTAALSGRAEGLAGVSGEDDVKGAVEGPGIETAQIIPDWRWGEIPCALGGDEDGTGPVLPFDEGPGVISGFGEHDAQIQASAACAEGQSVPGT